MSKKPTFLHIEDCIREIQRSKNVEQNLKTIGKLLSREFSEINKTLLENTWKKENVD